ncbi:MBL fold metallo-hydrolase [Aeromonas jandaei]|uniref:MBL fold metallo-hydrolase n=1 Tax=Aeromonas jandaei TaxID=650 RepID=UPI0011163EC0|nr:MBL fold metallo-hydrolase [Aeromonas jandaei]
MIIKYLGHQGWHFTVGDRGVTLDIVGGFMGNGFIKVSTVPERIIDDEIIEKTDIFIISHEHADHFEIDFLKHVFTINPNAEFFLPDLASNALEALLNAIGFKVYRFGAYQKLNYAGLKITALPCYYSRYEPDVYALFFEDTESQTSFFTPIDGVPLPESLEYVKQHTIGTRLDNFTNNFVSRPYNQHYLQYTTKDENLKNVNENLQRYIEALDSTHVVISGLGWKYHSENLNSIMFHVHHHELFTNKKDLKPTPALYLDQYNITHEGVFIINHKDYYDDSDRTFSPLKSNTYKFQFIDSFVDHFSFIQLQEWIKGELSLFISLGCKKLNKAMHYLMMEGINDSFCLTVYHEGKFYQFAYDFSNSRFMFVSSSNSIEMIRDKYTMGIALNSKDLFGVMQCSEEAHICFEVNSMTWNKRIDLLPEYSDVDIASVLHPRYRAAGYKEYYLSKVEV